MFFSLFLQNFREQGIDGSTLILLKEDHLVTTMKMRLGSVLKFKAALAKKMGSCPICLHCVHCHNEMTNEASKTAAIAATAIDKEPLDQKPGTPTEQQTLSDNRHLEEDQRSKKSEQDLPTDRPSKEK